MIEQPSMEQFETLTQYLLALKPKSFFDAGFGKLEWLKWCIKHNIEYEGMEIDDKLVERGREEYRQHASTLHLGDVTEPLPFDDNMFDIVLLVEVIEHIRTPERVVATLKECTRIAKRMVVITTPNCSDEELLKQYGLTYHHYRHAATDGMKFRSERDKAHRHWIKFTFDNLTSLLADNFTHFTVVPKRPIKLLKPVCYDKLWALINAEEEKK